MSGDVRKRKRPKKKSRGLPIGLILGLVIGFVVLAGAATVGGILAYSLSKQTSPAATAATTTSPWGEVQTYDGRAKFQIPGDWVTQLDLSNGEMIVGQKYQDRGEEKITSNLMVDTSQTRDQYRNWQVKVFDDYVRVQVRQLVQGGWQIVREDKMMIGGYPGHRILVQGPSGNARQVHYLCEGANGVYHRLYFQAGIGTRDNPVLATVEQIVATYQPLPPPERSDNIAPGG